MKKELILGIIISVGVVLATAAVFYFAQVNLQAPANKNSSAAITNFDQCAAAGHPIMESYPPQCRVPGGQIFTQYIGNELEKTNLIKVSQPRPNQKVSSPLLIEGEARGYWYFEADFPVYLFDENGKELAVAIAQAQDEWMTENFVPFKTTMIFTVPPGVKTGRLVFEKHNPSDLRENDDQLVMPVKFE